MAVRIFDFLSDRWTRLDPKLRTGRIAWRELVRD